MKFGSEEVFAIIWDNIHKEDRAENWYDPIYKAIQSDAAMILRSKGIKNQSDVEDIAMEVQIKVRRGLLDFAESSRDLSEAQRNKWLSNCIEWTKNDFFRKAYINNEVLSFERDEGEIDKETTADNGIGVYAGYSLDPGERVTQKMRLQGVLETLSKQKCSPERQLAFLLNKILAVSSEGKAARQANAQSPKKQGQKRNYGKPSYVAGLLNGKTFEDVFLTVNGMLSEFLQDDDVGDLMKPLWGNIEPVRTSIFYMSEKQIRDSNHFLSGKLADYKG